MSVALAEQFWAPFKQEVRGPDLRRYRFNESIKRLVHPEVFTSQVNGMVGGVPLVEDFFWTILTGFDIEHVSTIGSDEATGVTGTMHLVHRRPFMGWVPTADALTGDVTVDVPFYLHGERAGSHSMELSHLTLRSPLLESLQEVHGVPAVTIELLQNLEALRMLVALRRANVKPALITDRMLRSVSKKQDTWSNALGLQ
jgi:hypothetical protein